MTILAGDYEIIGSRPMDLFYQTTSMSRRALMQWSIAVATLSAVNDAKLAIAQSGYPVATCAIPHSNELIPVIGLWHSERFSDQPAEPEKVTLKTIIDELLAQGCKLIDTASSYGAAESVLGDLLSDQDRSKVFLATKIEDGSKNGGLSEFQNSLERLRYRQVDLLQQHNVNDPHQDLAPFRDWKAQGLCRYVGVTTTFKNDYDAAETVIRREKPDFFQVDYSLADRTAEERLLPAARDAGAAVLTALPFGRSSVFQVVRGKTVPEWAHEFGATTWAQFFLKFLLGHETVTAVIPGTTNPSHLADNISAGRGSFPDAGQRKAMVNFFNEL